MIATHVRYKGRLRVTSHRIRWARHQQREALKHTVVDNGTEPAGTRGASEYIAP